MATLALTWGATAMALIRDIQALALDPREAHVAAPAVVLHPRVLHPEAHAAAPTVVQVKTWLHLRILAPTAVHAEVSSVTPLAARRLEAHAEVVLVVVLLSLDRLPVVRAVAVRAVVSPCLDPLPADPAAAAPVAEFPFLARLLADPAVAAHVAAFPFLARLLEAHAAAAHVVALRMSNQLRVVPAVAALAVDRTATAAPTFPKDFSLIWV